MRISVEGLRVTVTAVQPDGTVIDQFSFLGREPAPQPELVAARAAPSLPAVAPPPQIDLGAIASDFRFAVGCATSSLVLGLALVLWRRRAR